MDTIDFVINFDKNVGAALRVVNGGNENAGADACGDAPREKYNKCEEFDDTMLFINTNRNIAIGTKEVVV